MKVAPEGATWFFSADFKHESYVFDIANKPTIPEPNNQTPAESETVFSQNQEIS